MPKKRKRLVKTQVTDGRYKAPEDRLTKRFWVSFTAGEADAICDLASEDGRTVPQWLRGLAIQALRASE